MEFVSVAAFDRLLYEDLLQGIHDLADVMLPQVRTEILLEPLGRRTQRLGAGLGEAPGELIREMIFGDQRTDDDVEGALDNVAQFTDVSGPGVVTDDVPGLGVEPLDLESEFAVELIDEAFGDGVDIVYPLPQGRNGKDHHVETVVEILPEFPLPHQGLEVAVGRRHHPDVHRLRGGAPQRDQLPFLEHPKQLHLHGERHVADFVQEDGAGVGLLEPPHLPPLPGTGESALRVAKEFRLQQMLRDGGAVHLDKGGVTASAGGVEGMGKKLFAGAALPAQQHVGILRRDPKQGLLQLGDLPAAPDNAVDVVLEAGTLRCHKARRRLPLGSVLQPVGEQCDLPHVPEDDLPHGTDHLAVNDERKPAGNDLLAVHVVRHADFRLARLHHQRHPGGLRIVVGLMDVLADHGIGRGVEHLGEGWVHHHHHAAAIDDDDSVMIDVQKGRGGTEQFGQPVGAAGRLFREHPEQRQCTADYPLVLNDGDVTAGDATPPHLDHLIAETEAAPHQVAQVRQADHLVHPPPQKGIGGNPHQGAGGPVQRDDHQVVVHTDDSGRLVFCREIPYLF